MHSSDINTGLGCLLSILFLFHLFIFCCCCRRWHFTSAFLCYTYVICSAIKCDIDMYTFVLILMMYRDMYSAAKNMIANDLYMYCR